MNGAPSVSLCVIARDEEDVLSSCLASVRHLVAEMIVVDTGSSDRTREVAVRAGAQVADFPWAGDFSAARNHSLDQAHGEWILVLDADELLTPVNREDLARLLEVPGVEGYFLTVKSFLGEGEEVAEDEVVRLFRRRPEYRFAGAIHEQVAGAITQHNGGAGLARVPEVVIEHFGYLDRRLRAKNKRVRNVSLLTRALTWHPDDPFLHYSLGTEYLQDRDLKGGIAHLEQALSGLKGDEGYLREVLILLVLAYLRDGQFRKARRTAARGALRFPHDPDLHLLRGVLAYDRRRPGTAVKHLQQALTRGTFLLARHDLHTLLGDACVLAGRFAEAEREYLAALRLAPHLLYPFTQLLGLRQRGLARLPWAEVSTFTTPARLGELRERLLSLGEDSVALVLAYLAVVAAAAGEAGGLTEACRGCVEAVRHPCLPDAPPWGGALRAYLQVATDELLVCAGMASARLECDFCLPREKAREVAATCLEAVIQGLCPPWRPVTSGRL